MFFNYILVGMVILGQQNFAQQQQQQQHVGLPSFMAVNWLRPS